MSIALILIVLLQTGKGSDIASAFGGSGSQAMFGSRGPASFLNKMTTIAALLFIVTSVGLSYLSIGNNQNSVMNGLSEPVEPDAQATDAAVPADDTVQTQESSTGQPAEQPADAAPASGNEAQNAGQTETGNQ